MTKSELINEVSTSKKYLGICKKLTYNFYQDLYQDILLVLLEKPESDLSKIDCVPCYFHKVASNMVYSKSNKFHFTYRRKVDDNKYSNYLTTESPYNENIDTLAKQSEEIIEKLYWYDKEIFKLYLEKGSIRKVSEETNIHYQNIYRTINKVKSEIKTQLKMPIKILLMVQQKTTALQYYRQLSPHERFSKAHPEFEVHQKIGVDNGETTLDDMTDDQLKEYSIVYFLRQVSFDKSKVDGTIDRLHSLGIKVMLDIDDYWELPKEHYWYNAYLNSGVSDSTINTLKKVDHVTTTTDYFADIIEQFNENVTVTPNCISPDDGQFTPRKIESERVRFGWIGGVFHKEDIKIMGESIKKLYDSRELNGKWQLCLGGYNPNPEYSEIERVMTCNYEFKDSDSTYYEYLSHNTPTMEHISFNKPYRRLWGKDIKEYASLYNDIDVALIPLVNNKFNNCKSELKIVEAGWMKKAVIVSEVTPYKEWIVNGKNGLVVKPSRNNIDWFVAIRKLILNPNMIEDLAGELHNTIKMNFDIDEFNKERANLYKSLI